MKKRRMNISKFRESLLIGVKEIRYNKTRSFLTLFGIMLGVASLIAMMSITEGYKRNFISFMDAWGGLARVSVKNVDNDTLAELRTTHNAQGLTVEDVDKILEENSDIVELVSPQKTRGRFIIKYGNKSIMLWGDAVVGATSEFTKINNLILQDGRDVTDFDDISLSRVTVIGSIIKNELFGESTQILGENISVNGRYITVVGYYQPYSTDGTVLPQPKAEEHTQAIVTNDAASHTSGRHLWRRYGMTDPFWRKNMNIVIPLSTYSLLYKPDDLITRMEIQFKDSEQLDDYVERIKRTLRSTRLGYEDFTIETQAEMFEQTQKQMKTMSLVFGAIAIISLLVGGIGIMNVILASISERIREIGVRKSVGARKSDIFIQFLIETIVLASMGGIFGVIVGSSISTLIARVAGMETFVSPFAIILSLLSSFVIGILFGIYPSVKAAKLNPIDALRYE